MTLRVRGLRESRGAQAGAGDALTETGSGTGSPRAAHSACDLTGLSALGIGGQGGRYAPRHRAVMAQALQRVSALQGWRRT